MLALLTAIQNYFTANSATLSGITGGLLTGEAFPVSDSVPFPYCVLFTPGGSTSRDFSQKEIDTCTIQFSLFGNPNATILQLAEALAAVFDGAQLSLSVGKNLTFNRKYPVRSYVDPTLRDANGNNVWIAPIVYDAIVQNP